MFSAPHFQQERYLPGSTCKTPSLRKPKASEPLMAAEDLIAATESAGAVRVLNCLPSIKTEEDWKIQNATSAGLAAATAVPLTKDLRESWWDVGNQGSTGSCVGWALADSVLRWQFVQTVQLDRAELLSPRFL